MLPSLSLTPLNQSREKNTSKRTKHMWVEEGEKPRKSHYIMSGGRVMQMDSSSTVSTSLTFYQILSASAKSRTHYRESLASTAFFFPYIKKKTIFAIFKHFGGAYKSSQNCTHIHLKLGILAMVEACKAANGVGDKSVEKKAENASSKCIILREWGQRGVAFLSQISWRPARMYSCLLLGNSITFMVWGQGGAMEHMSKGNEAETSLFAMYNCTVFSFSLYKVIKLVGFFC